MFFSHSSEQEQRVCRVLMDYSITELQQLTNDQRKQIEENQRCLFVREEHLKDLHRRTIPSIEQQQRKSFYFQTLRNQINEQKRLNSYAGLFDRSNELFFFSYRSFLHLTGNDLEILKEIYLAKEHQLLVTSNKLEQLTEQLDQLRQSHEQVEILQLRHSFSLDSLKEDSILDPDEFPIQFNVQRRSSLSDAEGLLIRYLNPTMISRTIEVRDDRSEDQETKIDSFVSDSDSEDSLLEDIPTNLSFSPIPSTSHLKSLLKTSTTSKDPSKRVLFDPLILLFDAAVLGDYELLVQSAQQVRRLFFFIQIGFFLFR